MDPTACLSFLVLIGLPAGCGIVALLYHEWWYAAIFFVLAYAFASPLFPDEERSNIKLRQMPDQLNDAEVLDVDGHTKQLNANGRSFLIWKDRSGIAWFQEVDKGGRPVGNQVRGADNAWQVGKTANEDLAEYLKKKINGWYD